MQARYAVLYVTDSDVVVGFRSVEYDLDSVAPEAAAAGLPLNLLREPPVPHPLVDPGTISIQPARHPRRPDPAAAESLHQAAFDSLITAVRPRLAPRRGRPRRPAR